MSRKLFGDGNGISGDSKEESSNIEYQPPEDESVEIGLTNRLVEHYISERDSGILNLWGRKGFESLTQTLESIVKTAGDELNTQILIGSLAVMLKDESDRKKFTRTEYLTAVIQGLYNLDCSNEFTINIRNWPEYAYWIGHDLRGRPGKPLTLNLYGNFGLCGLYAEWCSFTFYDNVRWCGGCGENCTFSLMPNANIGKYWASNLKGNKLRKMNDKGNWEILSAPSQDN